ncbi:MAG: hypothetical protein ACRDRP_03215 [Pseudonocardiaceae bacterium]
MSRSATSAPSRVTSLRPLEGLSTALFVHTVHLPNDGQPQAGVEAIRDLLDQDGIGVVYTIPRSRGRLGVASCCVDQTRKRSPGADILLDAARYTGSKQRKLAAEGIERSWLDHQHRDGLRWALTDSGYVARGDLQGLQTILREAARAHHSAQARNQGVIAALPLASSWLTDEADTLAQALRRASTPVALMLEDENDPLSRKNAVAGLVSVLRVDVPVAVLRCDMSVLGALAYGATAVSVGDSSTLRHFYPITDRDGPSRPPLATLVPELLGYYHLTKIDDAIAVTPDLPVWVCPCRVCGHRRLDWIANSTSPDVSAFEHAVSALADTARQLFGDAVTAEDRCRRWFQAIQRAQINHSAVIASTGQPWASKDALGRWITHYAETTSSTGVPD